MFLVNPEIVERSDLLSVHEEGCLSIPEYYAEVERPAAVIAQSVMAGASAIYLAARLFSAVRSSR